MQTTVVDTQHGTPIEYPSQLRTIKQTEAHHEGLKGRLGGMIFRAEAGDPEFSLLRDAVVRIGRSVYLDVPFFDRFLAAKRSAPPSPSRNPHGRAGKRPLRAAA